MVKSLNIGERQKLTFELCRNVRGFHEELNSYLVGVVEFLLGFSCNGCNVVDTQFKLIFFEKIEKVFVNETLRKQLQHFQVGVVGIAESGVLETRVVNCPHLIEQVKCDLSGSNRLFLGVYQFLHAEDVCLVEVHHCNVVEAAENIVLNFVLRECNA